MRDEMNDEDYKKLEFIFNQISNETMSDLQDVDNAKRNFEKTALILHVAYEAFIHVGFSEQDAMKLVTNILSIGLAAGVANANGGNKNG